MNWIRNLVVGDYFLFEELDYYGIINQITKDKVSWTWYTMDGAFHSSPCLSKDRFYSNSFLIPMTPLVKALL